MRETQTIPDDGRGNQLRLWLTIRHFVKSAISYRNRLNDRSLRGLSKNENTARHWCGAGGKRIATEPDCEWSSILPKWSGQWVSGVRSFGGAGSIPSGGAFGLTQGA